jgi:hypothetical protein
LADFLPRNADFLPRNADFLPRNADFLPFLADFLPRNAIKVLIIRESIDRNRRTEEQLEQWRAVDNAPHLIRIIRRLLRSRKADCATRRALARSQAAG